MIDGNLTRPFFKRDRHRRLIKATYNESWADEGKANFMVDNPLLSTIKTQKFAIDEIIDQIDEDNNELEQGDSPE